MSEIDALVERLRYECGAQPSMAFEIEFYLRPAPEKPLAEALFQAVSDEAVAAGIELEAITREEGLGQYEISLRPLEQIQTLADHLTALKAMLRRHANERGMQADFAAKPFADQPGSGLHVHIDLLDSNTGDFLLERLDGETNHTLLHALGGLEATMAEAMRIFAPHETSYARYKGQHVPTTISWGANNRTVALRLPWLMPTHVRHIEHRVPGADADPHHSCLAILAGIHHGLTSKLQPSDPVWGDANRALEETRRKLPLTLEESSKLFINSEIIKNYINERIFNLYAHAASLPTES